MTLAGATFIGENTYDQAGFCVAFAGDVNNDGYGDIMVGAPFRTNSPLSMSGKVYFILGSDSLSGDHSLCDADASIVGEAAYDRFGYCLSYAGMPLGEGSDLSLIAAPYNNGYRGKSSLYITKANTPPSAIDDVSITESSLWLWREPFLILVLFLSNLSGTLH